MYSMYNHMHHAFVRDVQRDTLAITTSSWILWSTPVAVCVINATNTTGWIGEAAGKQPRLQQWSSRVELCRPTLPISSPHLDVTLWIMETRRLLARSKLAHKHLRRNVSCFYTTYPFFFTRRMYSSVYHIVYVYTCIKSLSWIYRCVEHTISMYLIHSCSLRWLSGQFLRLNIWWQ